MLVNHKDQLFMVKVIDFGFGPSMFKGMVGMAMQACAYRTIYEANASWGLGCHQFRKETELTHGILDQEL